jgi:hypothetical protein
MLVWIQMNAQHRVNKWGAHDPMHTLFALFFKIYKKPVFEFFP